MNINEKNLIIEIEKLKSYNDLLKKVSGIKIQALLKHILIATIISVSIIVIWKIAFYVLTDNSIFDKPESIEELRNYIIGTWYIHLLLTPSAIASLILLIRLFCKSQSIVLCMDCRRILFKYKNPFTNKIIKKWMPLESLFHNIDHDICDMCAGMFEERWTQGEFEKRRKIIERKISKKGGQGGK